MAAAGDGVVEVFDGSGDGIGAGNGNGYAGVGWWCDGV